MPGDHMLWDDRCIHGNARGPGPSPAGNNLARCSVFCSMSPMRLLDDETRECRKQMALLVRPHSRTRALRMHAC
jgi:hypothetical protein